MLSTVQRAMKAGRGLRLGRIPVPELGGKSPTMLLNELKQTGKISMLRLEESSPVVLLGRGEHQGADPVPGFANRGAAAV